MFLSCFTSIWRSYQRYVESAMQSPIDGEVHDIDYWQKRLFTNAILFALPLSFLALIPSVYLECRSGNWFIAGFDIFALGAVGLIALARALSLQLRKVLIAFIIAIFAITLTLLFGEFSMGCIYLFSLSVFIALQFSDKAAYGIVAFNFFACACFAFVILYKVPGINLVLNSSFDHWLIYSFNFVLMDLIVVTLIRQILNDLISNMQKETWLFNELQKELAQTAYLNDHLKTSEEDYKTLFFQSPSPKMIFDLNTLKFLQVNIAASETYGYAEEEFLEMKLTDLHPEECLAEMLDHVHADVAEGSLAPYITQHLCKDGRRLHAEVRRSNIAFKGMRARLIITTDITQSVKFTAAIQQQNKKLREIAFIQSHVIRLPLARIMSLSELITQEYEGKIDQQLINFLNISTAELDTVIRDIVDKSEEVLAEDPGPE